MLNLQHRQVISAGEFKPLPKPIRQNEMLFFEPLFEYFTLKGCEFWLRNKNVAQQSVIEMPRKKQVWGISAEYEIVDLPRRTTRSLATILLTSECSPGEHATLVQSTIETLLVGPFPRRF